MGGLFGLLNGLCWATAVILYRQAGRTISPTALNLFKNVLGFFLMAITTLVVGDSFVLDAPWQHYAIMIGGGVLGIGIADSIFFASLNILGASRSAIVDCLYSPFIILFSYLVLGEKLHARDAYGGALIISGVLLVSISDSRGHSLREDLKGVALGALAMSLMGIAIVLVKPLLGLYPVLWSTMLRMGGGILILLFLAVFSPERRQLFKTFRPQRAWKVTIPSAVLGAFIGLLFWMATFKYASTNIAGLLTQSSAIFTVVLAVVWLKEPLTARKGIALALAVGGTVLVLL